MSFKGTCVKVILFGVLLSSVAEARVFDMSKEFLATYFKYNGGTSGLGRGAFENSSGSGTEFPQTVRVNYGGEIGVLLTLSRINFRIGFGGAWSQLIDAMSVTNASGTSLYTLTSRVTALSPIFGFELNFVQQNNLRVYFGISGGQVTAILQNNYTFTTDGTSSFGISDFSEEAHGKAIIGEAVFGFEALFTDNVTIVFDIGFRYLPIKELLHQKAVTTFNGAVVKGDAVVNTDGSTRSLDMSGAFAGLGFRFYFDVF